MGNWRLWLSIVAGVGSFALWMSIVGNPHVVETGLGILLGLIVFFVCRYKLLKQR